MKSFFGREDKELLMRWKLLTPAPEEDHEKFPLIVGRFTGDPANEFEHTEIEKTFNGEEQTEVEHTIVLKEESRLAMAIETINKEAVIVPFGAYIKTPNGLVVKNRSWEGLLNHIMHVI